MSYPKPERREHAPPRSGLLAGLTPALAEMQNALSLAKNELLTPEDIRQRSRYLAAALVAALWEESERELRRSNAWDFDDLLAFSVRLLREHPHRLGWIRARWRWLLV